MKIDKLWAREELWSRCPSTISTINCARYRSTASNPWNEPVLLVMGDRIQDYCLYKSLLSMKSEVYWLPFSGIENHEVSNSSDTSNQDLAWFATNLFSKGNRNAIKKILLTSYSLPDEVLKERANLLSKSAFIQIVDRSSKGWHPTKDVNEMLPFPVRLYELNNAGSSYIEQFWDGRSVSEVNTPRPKSFEHVPPYGHFWITDLTLENYQLPQRAEFGPSVIVQKSYESKSTRVTAEGFAYFCPFHSYFSGDLDSTLVRPSIHLLKPEVVFEKLFSAAGYYIRRSDKGNFQQEIMGKLGSFSDLCFCQAKRDPFDN